MTTALQHIPSVQINVSSKPPPKYQISEMLLDDCLCDPVFAAEFFFKEKLDVFQKARLKLWWWTPRILDHSGLSSAKTKTLWMVSNLRCLLMDDHVGGVYYQQFDSGQRNYWPYYHEVAARSEWFRHHIGKARVIGLDGMSEEVGKATLKNPSSWTCDYRNGSKIIMPAAGFSQDAKSQAGIRLNDLWVDEWTKIMAAGSEGIEDQLLGRCTRHCFNKHHPLWCNHMGFVATAESQMHPSYPRYKGFKEEEAKGNPNYYAFAFNYKDYSDEPYKNGQTFKIFREDLVMQDLRRSKSRNGFLQEGFGIWSVNGMGLYTEELIDKAYRIGLERKVQPLTTRFEERIEDKSLLSKVHYFCGIDPARAAKKKSDDGTMVTGRAYPLVPKPTSQISDWAFNFVWGYRVRGADLTEWSGLIHRKHLQFDYTRMVMDGGAGGGGNWIKDELEKSQQMIRGKITKVHPIACQEDETRLLSGDFILIMFKLDDERLKKYWSEQNLRGDDNLVDNAHKDFWEGFNCGTIGLPQPIRERDRKEVELWSEERRYGNLFIEYGARQLMRVSAATNEDGSIAYTSHNARSFSARGKKDFAYAMMYCYIGFLEWLRSMQELEEMGLSEEDEDQCL